MLGYPESLVEAVISNIADVLQSAGCTTARPSIVSAVAPQFKEKVTSLVEHAEGLKNMLGQARNLHVFIARPGETFEGGKMENTEKTEETPVLCATSIGLSRQALAEPMVAVLKTKVVLQSFLDY